MGKRRGDLAGESKGNRDSNESEKSYLIREIIDGIN